MIRRVLQSGLCLSTALVAACSGGDGRSSDPSTVPISHKSAALTAQQNTERALRGLLDAGGFVAESVALAESLSSLAGSTESCSGSYATPVCPADMPNCDTTPVYTEECVSEPNTVTVADLAESRQELHDAVDELVQMLRDEIFTEANLESEQDTQVTYLLGSDVLCAEDDSATVAPVRGDPAQPVPAEPVADESCEESAAKMQLRLRLTSPQAGDIDVEVLLTEEQTNPITLQLYQDRVGVVLDLGELKATADAVDEPLEGVSTLDGSLGVELVRNAELDYSLRLNVLEELHVVAGDAGQEVTVKLGKSVPTAELRLDGNARTITGSYDYGSLSVTAPLGAFFSDDEENYDDLGNPLPVKTYSGLIDVLVGGLSGGLTFDGNVDALNFTDLGLGDVSTTVKYDGQLLLQLDVNPDENRRFDLMVQSSGDASPTLTFSPTLDVRLLLGFEHLLGQVPDLESFLLNDSLRLWFEGEDPSIQPQEEGVRVVGAPRGLAPGDLAFDLPVRAKLEPAGEAFAWIAFEPD